MRPLLLARRGTLSRMTQVAPGTWEDPITISAGGTISNRWFRSTQANVYPISVRTASPVTIENCILESTVSGINDHLLDQRGSAAQLTIRNCTFNGPNAFPSAGWGRAIRCENYKTVLIENCSINRTGGIYFLTPAAGCSIIVRRNKCRNIQGHYDTPRQFLQLNGVHGGIVLAEWNEVINEPGLSVVEDNISVFNSSNVTLRNNYIEGGYPYPLTGPYRGTSILLSDVPGGFNNQAYNNQLVGNTNLLIGITGGHGHRIYNNTCVTDGKTPSGVILPAANNGVICYDYYGQPGMMYDNLIYDNKIGAMSENAGVLTRNDYWTPAANNNVNTDNIFYYGNHSTPIAKSDEDAEWPIWLGKLAANGITVGVV